MFGGLYFTASKMSHQFFFEFFGLLYLLDIMINSSFMSVLHLVCHLDLNSQSSHAFPALALTVNFISKFWRSSKFWDTFLLISFSPWNFEWMFFLYLFHLSHSFLLAYCSVLSVHGLPVSWCLALEYFTMFLAYVFITNMVAKGFYPVK